MRAAPERTMTAAQTSSTMHGHRDAAAGAAAATAFETSLKAFTNLEYLQIK